MRRGSYFLGRKIRAILFDMDGVLVESVDAWLDAFNSSLKEFGSRKITRKEFLEKYWKKGSVSKIIRQFRKDFNNPKLGARAIEHVHEKFGEYASESSLYPGSKRVLGKIRKRYKTGIVTNTRKHDVFRLLKKFGIEKYFDVIVTSDDVEKGKPSPDIVLKACKVLKVKPENCAVIGDSNADVKAGRAAGCTVIGVGISADAEIGKIAELEDFLAK